MTTTTTLPQFSATIFATDTAAVRDFYVDLFGLEVASDVGWFTSLRRGDGTWEVCVWDPNHESVPETVGAAENPMLAFVVDDVDAVEATARSRGVTILSGAVDEPWGQRHTFLQDPAGTVVDVVQLIEPNPEWMAANGL